MLDTEAHISTSIKLIDEDEALETLPGSELPNLNKDIIQPEEREPHQQEQQPDVNANEVPPTTIVTQQEDQKVELQQEETENKESQQSSSFEYGKHDEQEFDEYPSLKGNINGIAKFDDMNPQLLNHATIKALITQLTSPEVIDYDLIYDFFITYRMFSNSETVMTFLTIRLIWSLQYINNEDPERIKIGQSVLLRTFVVIRHWILNYFIDDFNNNHKLCDMFISTLNDIKFQSQLLKSHMVFEIKILNDLKIHWLRCIGEFWNVNIEVQDIVNFKLPLSKEMFENEHVIVKSPTQVSLHTNPSYRRSAMLSLYDTKIHKVLVYDEKHNENPQVSINNLLTQYKSTRQSIMNKLNTLTIGPVKMKPFIKHQMNSNDSSIALKKLNTTVNNSNQMKISLNPIKIENIGFSTNGNVKLPSSRIYDIVPSTPVRKMEYIINYNLTKEHSELNSPSKPLNRKRSIKKILDAWTKSVYHKPDKADEPIGERFDVLTARIIDELEFLIRHHINSHPPLIEGDTINNEKDEVSKEEIEIEFDDSIDLIGSPAKKYKVTTSRYQTPIEGTLENAEDSDMDINDLSELNFNKIDNLINPLEIKSGVDSDEAENQQHGVYESQDILEGLDNELPTNDEPVIHEFSFQRPTSINWNDELELSHIESKGGHTAPLFLLKNESQTSGISTPSNITAYDAEIEELGIAMSPRSMKDRAQRISVAYSNSSSLQPESVKSYISYDSAFSVSNDSSRGKKENDTGLKKKAAINDLRTLARLPSEGSNKGHSTASRKSIRYSVIRALSELPFDDSKNSRTSVRQSAVTLNDSDSNIDRTHSVAIPGISNSILKELAAIPDESFHFDPIESTLGKLEGKDRSGSDITKIDDTQDIMNEIGNVNTEDIIESLSVREEYTQEMPLNHRPVTPKTTIFQVEPSSATTITDDNVFIFSANYTRSTQANSVTNTPRFTLDNYASNGALSIDKIFDNHQHISFLLSYTSQELLEHFTIIERDVLQQIDWKELIELKWNKKLTPVNSWLELIVNDEYYHMNKGVNLVISRFNLMVNWIISEILLTAKQSERICIISRFIHIAQNCLELQNYSTLMQILLAVTSEKITKLKDTWSHLNPGDILILKHLEELSSPIKNFLNLRVSINQIQPSKGAIPFVGLYLSDLMFNTERPKFIDKQNKLINFARFRTSVHIVKSLSQCIEWSSHYNLTINDELLSKCLYLKSLNEDEMVFCLARIESP